MTTLTSIQPAKVDIIRMIESNPKLADSTKAQYKKAVNPDATAANLDRSCSDEKGGDPISTV